MKWEVEVTKNEAQRKIAYELREIDTAIPNILHGTVALALKEESDTRAWEMFEYARGWNREEHQTFDADEYLAELETLASMSRKAGMGQIYKDLSETKDYMEEHYSDLQAVLDGFRKIKLIEGLRANWYSN